MDKDLTNSEEIKIMLSGDKTTSAAAENLLIAVQKNDVEHIKEIVSEDVTILKYQYALYDYQTILTLACNDLHNMENVTPEVIVSLIELGAEFNKPSKNDHWEPLHYTSLNANKAKMEVLLKYLSKEEINSLVYCSKQIVQKYKFCPNQKEKKSYSNNSLSVLLKYGNRKNQFYECCKLLIDKGIDVNQTDSNGVSPSDLIWKLKDQELAQLLQNRTSKKSAEDSFGLIKLNTIQKFFSLNLTKEQANGLDGHREEFSSCTLLQLCCAKNLTSCVSYLLDRGADPNKVIIKNPNLPIMIAIKEDNEDIVKMLLRRNDVELPENILLDLQFMYKNTKNFAMTDKYMKIILKHLHRCEKPKVQKYLTCKDELERTALHYATFYRCPDNILSLLSLGASLIGKDVFGNTPLQSIEAKTLEKFFDNCMDVNVDYHGNKEFSVTLNYEALIDESNNEQESEFLSTMIHNKNLNFLMNHPIVATYLTMKWEKFKMLVYINLVFYFFAYVSLLVYGFTSVSISQTSNSLLLFAVTLLLFGESLQILIFRSHYFRRLENFIDLFLLVGLIYINASSWYETLNNHNLLMAFSVVFLTSTLGIFMQLGNLSFFTIKVIVLQQITINFLKYVAFYSFPLLAFFFCFFMLSENKNNLFFQMLYKTVIMYAGESDAEYPKQFKTNPIFGHFIYIVFIILIGIILHNLLIGLAVNDLQDIQNEAEFIDKKERSKYITNVEDVFFRKLQTSHYFHSMFAKLLNYCRLFKFGNNRTLVIYSNSQNVYVKEKMGQKKIIRDKAIIKSLQNVFKNSSLKNEEIEESYSLKSLHRKLEKLEKLISSQGKQTLDM